MALRGTLTHWKTRSLAAALGIMPCFALGTLEALWHATAKLAPAGDIGRVPNHAIALEMFYEGDADALVAALVAARYLDLDDRHRLVVHNWHKRADDTVDLRLGRDRLRYANGSKPRLTKLSVAERQKIWADYLVPTHTSSLPFQDAEPEPQEPVIAQGFLCPAGALPEPVPVPDPETKTPPTPKSGVGRGGPGTVLTMPKPPVLPPRSAPGDANWHLALDSAARWVAHQGHITRDGTIRVLKRALEGQVIRGQPLDEVAALAAENYAVYLQDVALMRFRWGPDEFFGNGAWCMPGTWPYDEAKRQRRHGAAVGMYRPA